MLNKLLRKQSELVDVYKRQLVAWLMGRYDLTTDDVIRHYDVTGKDCPKYFVENSKAWSDFKTDLLTYIDTYGIEKTQEIN